MTPAWGRPERPRYYYTEFGMLNAEDYHSALGRWPGCRECGYSDPAEVARGAIDSQGLCGECSDRPEPECECAPGDTCEGHARERMAEERAERERGE